MLTFEVWRNGAFRISVMLIFLLQLTNVAKCHPGFESPSKTIQIITATTTARGGSSRSLKSCRSLLQRSRFRFSHDPENLLETFGMFLKNHQKHLPHEC